jgi:hypothetical protein
MAVRVVQRARLQAGERILDAGTGTGVGAAASRLAGPDSFEQWMRTGSRSGATHRLSPERFAQFQAELLAVTPTAPDGMLHISFGTLYLTARN